MRGALKLMAVAGVLAIAGPVAGCGGGKETAGSAAPAASSAGVQYHCAMHPEVVRSEPGTCPRCKMALTKR